MVFQLIRSVLYYLMVKSRIIWYFMPLVKKYISWTLERGYKRLDHHIVDDSGQKLKALRLNDTNYPPLCESNFLNVKNLKIRTDDIMICGYPKTGCHWTYEVVRMIVFKTTSASKYGKSVEGMIEMLPEFVLDSIPSPRILNSHLLYDQLPEELKAKKKTKIVLTQRCPKDVIVSYYNHHRYVRESYGYRGSFQDYFKLFMTGDLPYGNYFEVMANWKRVMTSSGSCPVFLVEYEEMKQDPVVMIKKLARFLDCDISEDLAQEIARCTDFKNLKAAFEKDKYFTTLYRKGIVGDWKNWLTEEQSAEVDARMKEVEKQ